MQTLTALSSNDIPIVQTLFAQFNTQEIKRISRRQMIMIRPRYGPVWVGILLCTNKNDELVKYALGGMDENLFVSQYQTALPSTEELEAFLNQEMKNLKTEGS